MRAFLGFLSLYRYNQTLFDGFVIPEGVDKNLVINNLLLEYGELEVVYPDFNFMKQALEYWSQKQLHVWEELYKTLLYEYDPIENYDRKEDWTDTDTTSGTRDITRINTITGNQTSKQIDDASTHDSLSTSEKLVGSQNGDSTTTTSVSAYNSSSFEPRDEVVADTSTSTNNTTSTTGTNTRAYNNTTDTTIDTDSTENGNDKEKTTGNRNGVHEGRVHGNIGVTTTQHMIKAQREVVEFNIVSRIINDTRDRFCLLVY